MLYGFVRVNTNFIVRAAKDCSTDRVPDIISALVNVVPAGPFGSLDARGLLRVVFFSLLLKFSLVGLNSGNTPILGFFHT